MFKKLLRLTVLTTLAANLYCMEQGPGDGSGDAAYLRSLEGANQRDPQSASRDEINKQLANAAIQNNQEEIINIIDNNNWIIGLLGPWTKFRNFIIQYNLDQVVVYLRDNLPADRKQNLATHLVENDELELLGLLYENLKSIEDINNANLPEEIAINLIPLLIKKNEQAPDTGRLLFGEFIKKEHFKQALILIKNADETEVALRDRYDNSALFYAVKKLIKFDKLIDQNFDTSSAQYDEDVLQEKSSSAQYGIDELYEKSNIIKQIIKALLSKGLSWEDGALNGTPKDLLKDNYGLEKAKRIMIRLNPKRTRVNNRPGAGMAPITVAPPKTSTTNTKLSITAKQVVGGVVTLGVIGLAGYWLYSKSNNKNSNKINLGKI